MFGFDDMLVPYTVKDADLDSGYSGRKARRKKTRMDLNHGGAFGGSKKQKKSKKEAGKR